MASSSNDEAFTAQVEGLKALVPSPPIALEGILEARGSVLRSLADAAIQSPPQVLRARASYRLPGVHYIRWLRVYGPDIEAIRRSYRFTSQQHTGKTKVLGTRSHAGAGHDSRVLVDIEGFVQEIAIEPTGKKPAKITSIVAIGYAVAELDVYARQIREHADSRDAIEAFMEKVSQDRSSAEAAVAKLLGEAEAARTEIAGLVEKRAELEAEIESSDEQAEASKGSAAREKKALNEIRASIATAQNNEAQLKTEVAKINEDIATKKDELRQLTSDRNTISDEFRDYVSEGKGQASLYSFFAVLSLCAVGAAVVALIEGARKVALEPTHNLSEAYALIVQRAPFASALVLTITLLLTLVNLLVKSIFAIHASRLTLARLLVVARETVESSLAGLVVPDEVAFKERIRLKVELLRLYMTQELGHANEGAKVDGEAESDSESPAAAG